MSTRTCKNNRQSSHVAPRRPSKYVVYGRDLEAPTRNTFEVKEGVYREHFLKVEGGHENGKDITYRDGYAYHPTRGYKRISHARIVNTLPGFQKISAFLSRCGTPIYVNP